MRKLNTEQKKIDELEEYLIESGTATQREIHLIYDINGYSLKSLEDILFVRTGYHSLDQILDE